MKNYNQYPEGSTWAKWDLHVHTPCSVEQEYGGDKEEVWEKYVTDLENLDSSIKIIGINDYLFIDGYRRLCEYRKKGRLKNIDLLLPVIEFRLKIFAGNKDLNKINFHVIFSNDVSADTIQEKFLNNLNVDFEHIKWNESVETLDKLIEFGKKCKENAPIKNNDSDKEWGFKNLTHDHKKIYEILSKGKYDFYDDHGHPLFFTAIGKSEWEDMRWESAGADKKEIINNVDFVFCASKNANQYDKGKQKLISQGVNSNLFHFSDAHDFSKNYHKENKTEFKHQGLGDGLTWIKANPTFEGLRQIIHEYSDRVKILDLHKTPNIKDNHAVIKSICYINESEDSIHCIPDKIPLNPDLNVIIGGKSTGKSLLLHFIAKTCKVSEESFLQIGDFSIQKNYKDYEKTHKLDFEVEWSDGTSYKLSDKETKHDKPLEYLPQQWLSEMVTASPNKLTKLIEKLLSEKNDFTECKNQFNDDVNSHSEYISSNLLKLSHSQLEIKKYQHQLSDLHSKQDIQNRIDEIKNNIIVLQQKSGLSIEQQENFKQLQNEQIELKSKLTKLENQQNNLSNFKTDFQTFFENFKQKVQESSIKYSNNFPELEQLTSRLQNSLDEYTNSIFETESQQFNTILIVEIKICKEKVESNKTQLQPFLEREKDNNQISELQEKLQKGQEYLGKLENIEQLLMQEKTQLQKHQKTLIDKYIKLYETYQNYANKINTDFKTLDSIDETSSVELNLSVSFDYRFFEERFIEKFMIREKVNKEIVRRTDFYDNSYDKKQHIKYVEETLQLLINDNQLTFKKGFEAKDGITELFHNYFGIKYNIKYDGDLLENMSQGKQGIILLKLYLSVQGVTHPILIDQPEDNLDNRTIYQSLIKFIKQRKIQRQIIMVTHNANLVVATDAEQIIVANQDGQNGTENKKYKFEYISGALEHSFPKNENKKGILYQQGIREHVCEILEGGKEAFKKREEKYGF